MNPPAASVADPAASRAGKAGKAGNGDDGPRANERLTAWAGAALFVLLAAEGLTILLSARRLLVVHVVVGLLLVGPLVVKLASTGYRFVRYYTRHPAYVAAGPPRTWLRVLAPLLVVSTVAVPVTGTALLVLPGGLLLLAHKASFVGWLALAALHVLAYVWRVPALLLADLRARGGVLRAGAVLVSLPAAAVLAWWALPLAQSWSGAFGG